MKKPKFHTYKRTFNLTHPLIIIVYWYEKTHYYSDN